MTPDEAEQIKARLEKRDADPYLTTNPVAIHEFHEHAPSDIRTLLSDRDSLTAALAEAQGNNERLQTEINEALAVTESCSTLKEMTAACIEGAALAKVAEGVRQLGPEVAQLLDAFKIEGPWSNWDQQVRRRVTALMLDAGAVTRTDDAGSVGVLQTLEQYEGHLDAGSRVTLKDVEWLIHELRNAYEPRCVLTPSPGLSARHSAERRVVEAAIKVNAATFSHVDGRDLLAELHPRKELDIKRRKDGVETWFEGDWLSNVYTAIKPLREALSALPAPVGKEKT